MRIKYLEILGGTFPNYETLLIVSRGAWQGELGVGLGQVAVPYHKLPLLPYKLLRPELQAPVRITYFEFLGGATLF